MVSFTPYDVRCFHLTDNCIHRRGGQGRRPDPPSPNTAHRSTAPSPSPRPQQPTRLLRFMSQAKRSGLNSSVFISDNNFYLFWQGDFPILSFSPASSRLVKTFHARSEGGAPLILTKAGCLGIGEVSVEVYNSSARGLMLRHYCCAARVPVWAGRYLSQYKHKSNGGGAYRRDSGYNSGSAASSPGKSGWSTDLEKEEGDIAISIEHGEEIPAPTPTEDEDEGEGEDKSSSNDVYQSTHWDDLAIIIDDIVNEGNDPEWPAEIDVSVLRHQISRGVGYEALHPGEHLEDDALYLLDDLLGCCFVKGVSSLPEAVRRYEEEQVDQ